MKYVKSHVFFFKDKLHVHVIHLEKLRATQKERILSDSPNMRAVWARFTKYLMIIVR